MGELTRRERERLAHETDIINAAEKVFSRKGFEDASMDEIAKEAEFTRRTVYQYFANKEDLFFAVVLRIFQRLFAYFQSAMVSERTGFDKIRQGGDAYYRFYKENPDLFRLMNYIGYIRSHSEAGSRRNDFLKFDDMLFQSMIELIRQGQADGSIKVEISADQSAYSLIFVLTGFLHQLSFSGPTFTQHFKLDEETFVHSTLELIYQALRA